MQHPYFITQTMGFAPKSSAYEGAVTEGFEPSVLESLMNIGFGVLAEELKSQPDLRIEDLLMTDAVTSSATKHDQL
jgi:hypothetical protein